jgi:hypothetical protein
VEEKMAMKIISVFTVAIASENARLQEIRLPVEILLDLILMRMKPVIMEIMEPPALMTIGQLIFTITEPMQMMALIKEEMVLPEDQMVQVRP